MIGNGRTAPPSSATSPVDDVRFLPAGPSRRPVKSALSSVVEMSEMASIRQEIHVKASPEAVWDAIRDIGALHHRLVPGFVVDTKLEPGARIVTFGNGMVVRELIVDVNDDSTRVVWSVQSELMTQHNWSSQVFKGEDGHTIVTWIADLLPDEAAGPVGQMMEQGIVAMKKTLDALGEKEAN